MTGLLYKTIRTNWGKLLAFFLGMTVYPAMIALALHTDEFSEMEEHTVNNLFLVMFGMGGFIAFLIGGACECAVFRDDERKKWAYFITSTPTGIKGHIGSKYLFTLIWAMLTVTMLILCNGLAADGNKYAADASVIFIALFYIQLFIRSVEYPLMARFGAKTGNTFKITLLCVLTLGFVIYLLFGDTSPFENMDNFWGNIDKARNDPETLKKAMLWFSILTAAVIPVYYLSYRLSVRWYLKGVESYEK